MSEALKELTARILYNKNVQIEIIQLGTYLVGILLTGELAQTLIEPW